MLRRQPIGKIHHRKTSPCQVHAVEPVSLLVPVHPSSAVDADNDRKQSFPPGRTVHIHHLHGIFCPVADIPVFFHIFRLFKTCVPDIVPCFEVFPYFVTCLRHILTTFSFL